MKNAAGRTGVFIALFAVMTILQYSCTGPGSLGQNEQGNAGPGGYLSLFLDLKEYQNIPDVEMNILSIDVLSDTGSWYPIASDAFTLEARKISQGQVFLGRGLLQPGYYSRIRLTLKNLLLRQQEGEIDLTPDKPTIEIGIPTKLYLDEGDSHSVFLSWDVRASLEESHRGMPVIQVAPRLRNLIADVAYVSCPEINTVFMIRTDKNKVCDSLGVGGHPTYLSSSAREREMNLFVLTNSGPEIKRISPSANRVVENYTLPLTGKAAHMTIDPSGQTAYIVDSQRGTVMSVSLQTGRVDHRERLGYDPAYIIYLHKQNLLAVSIPLSQSVALLNPETLTSIGSVATGIKPEGLMQLNDTKLYIAESGGNSVLVYDLERKGVAKRIPVDFSPRRILGADGYVYVSNYGSRTISVLRPGQPGVSRNIILSGAPLEMAYVPTSQWIYVGNEENKSISVIDPVTSTMVTDIQLGSIPGGIAVIDR